jgi:hypothetical protein
MKDKKKSPIIFIASGQDFHALDWFITANKVTKNREFIFITDLIEAEGHKKILPIDINLKQLFVIDRFLFSVESFLGNKWRNVVKLFFIPIQIYKLKKFLLNYPNSIIHAHTMYYSFLCWAVKSKYITSPQGDEILIRPYRSNLYKFFLIQVFKSAHKIIVDSESLKEGVYNLSKQNALIHQYGIDFNTIKNTMTNKQKRHMVSSIRGFYPLYRIERIIESREISLPDQPINFFYPFWENQYRIDISSKMARFDTDLKRIKYKKGVFKILSRTLLAISIPKSDSSPRSVYEAIFCGSFIATTYNKWIDSLPNCMKERIIIINIDNKNWFRDVVLKAKSLQNRNYIPSNEAINMFDQERSIKKVVQSHY